MNYNVSGLPGNFSAKELEEEIKKHVRDFVDTYKPDREIVDYLRKYDTTMQAINDTKARNEWGWRPLYDDLDTIVSDYMREARNRPGFFEVTKE